MGRVTNTESFIREAILINEDRYDYSLVKYTKSSDKVEIICKIHGSFWQHAEGHLHGHGCPVCRKRSRGIVIRGLMIDRKAERELGKKRQCSKCGGYFERDYFYPDKKVADGLSSKCKDCSELATRDWEERNIEHVRARRIKEGKERWAKHKEEHKAEYEQRAEERRLKSIENKKLDKIGRKIRARIRDAVQNGIYRPHMKELIGCSLEFFKSYIESLWTEGMSWDNYNYYGWHLDHIKPIASFNLHNVEEQKECFHYTNHQPMWRKPNQLKGAKYKGKDYHKPNRK